MSNLINGELITNDEAILEKQQIDKYYIPVDFTGTLVYELENKKRGRKRKAEEMKKMIVEGKQEVGYPKALNSHPALCLEDRKRHQKALEEVEKFKLVVGELEERNRLLNSAWVDSAGEVNGLRIENSNLKEEVESLKKQKKEQEDGKQVQINNLNNEIESLKRQKKQLQYSKQVAISNLNDEIESVNRQKNQSHDGNQTEISNLKAEVELLKRQKKQLQDGNQVLQIKYAGAQKRVLAMTDSNALRILRDIAHSLSPMKNDKVNY
jgi:DNA repair exonuclease SbcCD ATPase subunit